MMESKILSKWLFLMSEEEFCRWMDEEFTRTLGSKKDCPGQQKMDLQKYPEKRNSIYA